MWLTACMLGKFSGRKESFLLGYIDLWFTLQPHNWCSPCGCCVPSHERSQLVRLIGVETMDLQQSPLCWSSGRAWEHKSMAYTGWWALGWAHCILPFVLYKRLTLVPLYSAPSEKADFILMEATKQQMLLPTIRQICSCAISRPWPYKEPLLSGWKGGSQNLYLVSAHFSALPTSLPLHHLALTKSAREQRPTPIGKNIPRKMKATHWKVSFPPEVTFTDKVWCLTNILLSSWLRLYRAIHKNELKAS